MIGGSLRGRVYYALNRLCGAPPVVDIVETRAHHAAQTTSIEPLQRVARRFPYGAVVLVVGCDEHATEVRWIVEHTGARLVVGVDLEARVVSRARSRSKEKSAFVQVDDATLPFASECFDVIYMHNVCEHLVRIEEAFAEYRRVLRPGGLLLNDFAPLFFSPFGAHFSYALRLPWGHLMFGLRAVVDVRNHYYPQPVAATTWEDLGLNRLTIRRYARVVQRFGFRSLDRRVHVSRGLPGVRWLPLVRHLFIHRVQDVLVRDEPPRR